MVICKIDDIFCHLDRKIVKRQSSLRKEYKLTYDRKRIFQGGRVRCHFIELFLFFFKKLSYYPKKKLLPKILCLFYLSKNDLLACKSDRFWHECVIFSDTFSDSLYFSVVLQGHILQSQYQDEINYFGCVINF